MSLSRAAFVVFAVAASIVAVTGIDSDQAAPDEPVAKAEPPTQALVSLDPPPDLDAAVEAARDFTAALIGDDHAVIRRLAAGPLIDRLSDSATAAPAGRSEAQVESTLVRDARPDRVLVDVIVNQDPDATGAIGVVTVALGRTPDGWRVVDTAF